MIDEYAKKIMKLTRDSIIVKYRFFDVAIAKIKFKQQLNTDEFLWMDGVIGYNPRYVVKKYKEEKNYIIRIYLHILLHNIFMHPYRIGNKNEVLWNLAADIAVENIILGMDFSRKKLNIDTTLEREIDLIKKNVDKITADNIYKYFVDERVSITYIEKLENLFSMDNHGQWKAEKKFITDEVKKWDTIARRVRTELNVFSNRNEKYADITMNIDESVKERYDYKKLLNHFLVSGEEIGVSDDEFDYIYYLYGLEKYGNMPLIEPIEYKETKKIREFVVAIDTSMSCSGELIQKFIKRTYEILSEADTYFTKTNIRIIQCDSAVKSDKKIESKDDMLNYINNEKLVGFGNTDYRPLFYYVDQLVKKGKFENLKGIIYFTDGEGIYPSKKPEYEVIFALEKNNDTIDVPHWAVKIVMEDEQYEHK